MTKRTTWNEGHVRPELRWSISLISLFFLLCLCAGSLHAGSTFKVANVKGPSGVKLKLQIKLPGTTVQKGTSLTFYGLPDQLRLSEGIRRSKVWIVPITKSEKLTLFAPKGFKGHFESAAILRKKNGQVIEGQRFVVSITNQSVTKPTHRKRTQKPQVAQQPAKNAVKALSIRTAPTQKKGSAKNSKKNISEDLEVTLLAKAKQLLKDGNIVAARETLKFLAKQGNAESAYLIAKTYDPEQLKEFNAAGMEPDLDKAKKWYIIAADLGAEEAKTKLKEYADAGL